MQKGTFDPEKGFQILIEKIDQVQADVKEIKSTVSDHTGTLAEILVTTNRLDDERLVGIHRVNRLETELGKLRKQVAGTPRR